MSNTNSICQKYPVAPLVLRLLSEWSPSTIFRLVFAMWPCQIFTDRFSTASWNVDDAERRVQHRSWRGKRILTCVYLYLWFQRGETFSNWIRLVWKSFLPERIKSFVCLCIQFIFSTMSLLPFITMWPSKAWREASIHFSFFCLTDFDSELGTDKTSGAGSAPQLLFPPVTLY